MGEVVTVDEQPIPFSGPMVRAILDGRKTQTRRVVKPTPRWHERTIGGHLGCSIRVENGIAGWYGPAVGSLHREWGHGVCRYGVQGDRLWVRETWSPMLSTYSKGAIYRADGENFLDAKPRWRPSIFMPRWASRITLEITGVRVERLREISQQDAQAEGFEYKDNHSPKGWFAGTWSEINGIESWEANPWVWVVEFRRIKP